MQYTVKLTLHYPFIYFNSLLMFNHCAWCKENINMIILQSLKTYFFPLNSINYYTESIHSNGCNRYVFVLSNFNGNGTICHGDKQTNNMFFHEYGNKLFVYAVRLFQSEIVKWKKLFLFCVVCLYGQCSDLWRWRINAKTVRKKSIGQMLNRYSFIVWKFHASKPYWWLIYANMKSQTKMGNSLLWGLTKDCTRNHFIWAKCCVQLLKCSTENRLRW